MANIFRHDGHLQDQALLSLIQGEPMEELERLEIAEHLSYCDQCLHRYTQLLSGIEPATPRHSCQKTIWAQIRRKSLLFFSQRYAAAAAAVALALTLLWGSVHPDFIKVKEALENQDTTYTQALQNRWDGAMEHTAAWLSDLIDHIDPLQERITP